MESSLPNLPDNLAEGYYNNLLQNKIINSAIFTESSLSNPVGSLAEGFHKIKSKDCNCL